MNSSKERPTQVAEIINPHTIILNKGAKDGVHPHSRFVIYKHGIEILDPTSGESLGILEVVKGTGRVTHLQDSMCTIQNEKEGKQFVSSIFPSGFIRDHFEDLKGPLPFIDPEIGDFAREV